MHRRLGSLRLLKDGLPRAAFGAAHKFRPPIDDHLRGVHLVAPEDLRGGASLVSRPSGEKRQTSYHTCQAEPKLHVHSPMRFKSIVSWMLFGVPKPPGFASGIELRGRAALEARPHNDAQDSAVRPTSRTGALGPWTRDRRCAQR